MSTLLPPDFHPVLQRWWASRFAEPTAAQLEGWRAIRRGEHTLIAAPTGSGKTLAAFLTSIDELLREGLEQRRAAGRGARHLRLAAEGAVGGHPQEPRRAAARDPRARRGDGLPAGASITAAVRSGDTPQSERAAMLRKPPHILVTTPESLYLLLTAERSREMLKTARVVIVDEIHAVLRIAPRRAPRALARAPRARLRAQAAAHRPVGDAEADRGSRALPRRHASRATARSSTAATSARSTSRSKCPARRSKR